MYQARVPSQPRLRQSPLFAVRQAWTQIQLRARTTSTGGWSGHGGASWSLLLPALLWAWVGYVALGLLVGVEARDLHSQAFFLQDTTDADIHAIAAATTVGPSLERDILPHFLRPRVSGSPGNRQVQEYLIKTFQDLGWHIEQDTFTANTPMGPKTFNNIVATQNPEAPKKLVMAAHFDSKYFADFAFVGVSAGIALWQG